MRREMKFYLLFFLLSCVELCCFYSATMNREPFCPIYPDVMKEKEVGGEKKLVLVEERNIEFSSSTSNSLAKRVNTFHVKATALKPTN